MFRVVGRQGKEQASKKSKKKCLPEMEATIPGNVHHLDYKILSGALPVREFWLNISTCMFPFAQRTLFLSFTSTIHLLCLCALNFGTHRTSLPLASSYFS